MAAGAWQFYDEGLEDILDGTTVLTVDTIKMQLHTSSYSPSTSDTSATNEVAAGNGYTTGGIACTITVTNAAGVITIDSTTNPQWTASGAGITAKYAVLKEDGATQPLAYADLDTGGGSLTATDGNTFTVTINASGIATMEQT